MVVVDVERVSTSCGFGVPLMEHRGQRSELDEWTAAKAATGDGLAGYRARKNAASIDGLPGFPVEG